MRAAMWVAALAALAGCNSILGIPSDSSALCEDKCVVTVNGDVLPVDKVAATPKPNVRVTLTSLPIAEQQNVRVTSNAAGAYTLGELDLNTALEMEMSFEQLNPTVSSGLLVTRYLAGNASENKTVNVPVVEFRWLAKVAFQCGLFASENDAVFEPGTSTVNFYYITRSTILGEVLNEDGTPATINRADITVTLDGYENTHENADDTDFLPKAHICFLEPDTDGSFKGVAADRTTSGRFVMFRTRDASGTGRGYARVLIPDFPPGSVNLRSSGVIGFVRIQKGTGEPPLPARPKTFETDIYPMLSELGCVACHRPGGPGYEMGMIRGGLRADWSGTVDEVYRNLTEPPMAGCENGGATAARVCLTKPDASLFYTKPRLETGDQPSDHKGIAFPEDSNAIKLILEWISGGAVIR